MITVRVYYQLMSMPLTGRRPVYAGYLKCTPVIHASYARAFAFRVASSAGCPGKALHVHLPVKTTAANYRARGYRALRPPARMTCSISSGVRGGTGSGVTPSRAGCRLSMMSAR
jgi:hypothetical protein